MTAIVFVSGLAAEARFRVAGLGLLQRALLVAARAGVRRCLIVGAAPRLEADVRYPRLTPVADLDDARAILRSEGVDAATRILCLSAEVVSTPPSLRSLLADESERAVLALHSVPVALVACAALDAVWPSLSQPASGGLDRLTPAGGIAFTHVPQGFFAWVRSRQQVTQTEKQLLLSLGNPRDGRLDTLLNRRLSRPLTRLLLRLPLTANHVTVLALLTGLLAALAFARGTHAASIAGALLFQLVAVLDSCDGEVARVKLQESRFGDALDISFDAIANAAVFLGIARGTWVAGQLPDVFPVAWALGLGIIGTFPLVTWAERSLPAPAATPEHRLVQTLVSSLTTRDFSAVLLAAALTGTLPWFLRGAAVGANVLWVVLLVLIVRGRAARQP